MSIFKDLFAPSEDDHPKEDEQQQGEVDGIPAVENAVLEKVARKVVDWGMTVPAILFLESIKPLNYVGSQAMVFFQPIVQAIFSIKDYDDFRVAMERRENVENLLQKIEALDAIAHKREKLYRKKLRQERKKWKWYQRYLGIKQPRIEIDPKELEELEKPRNKGDDSHTGDLSSKS